MLYLQQRQQQAFKHQIFFLNQSLIKYVQLLDTIFLKVIQMIEWKQTARRGLNSSAFKNHTDSAPTLNQKHIHKTNIC